MKKGFGPIIIKWMWPGTLWGWLAVAQSVTEPERTMVCSLVLDKENHRASPFILNIEKRRIQLMDLMTCTSVIYTSLCSLLAVITCVFSWCRFYFLLIVYFLLDIFFATNYLTSSWDWMTNRQMMERSMWLKGWKGPTRKTRLRGWRILTLSCDLFLCLLKGSYARLISSSSSLYLRRSVIQLKNVDASSKEQCINFFFAITPTLF